MSKPIREQRSWMMAPSPSVQYESPSPQSSFATTVKESQQNLLKSLADDDDDVPPSPPTPLHEASDASASDDPDETVNESVDVEQLQTAIEELRSQLRAEKRKNREMEGEIRKEVGEGYEKIMKEMHNFYTKQREEEREDMEDLGEKRMAIALDSERRRRNNFVSIAKHQEVEAELEEAQLAVETLKEKLRQARRSTGTSFVTANISFSPRRSETIEPDSLEETKMEDPTPRKPLQDEKDKQISELNTILEEAAEAYQEKDAAVHQLSAKVAALEAEVASLKTELEKPPMDPRNPTPSPRNASVWESTKMEDAQPSTSRPPIMVSPIRSAAPKIRVNDETLAGQEEEAVDFVAPLPPPGSGTAPRKQKQRRRFSKLVKKNKAYELRVNSSPSVRHNHNTGSLYLNPRDVPAPTKKNLFGTKASGAKPKTAVVASSVKKRRSLFRPATNTAAQRQLRRPEAGIRTGAQADGRAMEDRSETPAGDKDAEIHRLMEELRSLKDQTEGADGLKLIEFESKLFDLERNVESLKKEKEALETEAGQLRQQMSSAVQEKELAEQKAAELETRISKGLAESSRCIQDLERERAEQLEANRKLEKDLSVVKEALREFDAEKEGLEQKICQLEAEVERVKEEAQQQKTSLEARVAQKDEELAAKDQTMSSSSQVAEEELEEAKKSFETEKAGLQATLQQSKAKMAKSLEEKEDLEKELDEVGNELEELRQFRSSLEEQLESTASDRERLTSKVAELEETIVRMEKKKDSNMNERLLELHNAKEELVNLKKAKLESEQRLQSVEAELERTSRKADSMRELINAAKDTERSLTKERDEWKEKCEEGGGSHHTEFEKLLDEKKHLEQRLEMELKQSVPLHTALNQLQSERHNEAAQRDVLQASLSKANEEVMVLKRQIDQKSLEEEAQEKQLEEKGQTVAMLEKKLNSCQRDLAETKRQLQDHDGVLQQLKLQTEKVAAKDQELTGLRTLLKEKECVVQNAGPSQTQGNRSARLVPSPSKDDADVVMHEEVEVTGVTAKPGTSTRKSQRAKRPPKRPEFEETASRSSRSRSRVSNKSETSSREGSVDLGRTPMQKMVPENLTLSGRPQRRAAKEGRDKLLAISLLHSNFSNPTFTPPAEEETMEETPTAETAAKPKAAPKRKIVVKRENKLLTPPTPSDATLPVTGRKSQKAPKK